MDGTYLGQVQDGYLMLVRLPLGYGLNIGASYERYLSLKPYEQARNDYRDQFSMRGFGRWLKPKTTRKEKREQKKWAQ